LFEISWIFGWAFGGGSLDRLEQVKLAAYHLGMAFQLADDLSDYETSSSLNAVAVLGVEKTRSLLEESVQKFEASLVLLGLKTKLEAIVEWLQRPLLPAS